MGMYCYYTPVNQFTAKTHILLYVYPKFLFCNPDYNLKRH